MDNHRVVRVLAICGSLRRASSNGALLDAAARLASDVVQVSMYGELAELPAFSPDLDGDIAPEAVGRFRAGLRACDAVLISSPEYAHGVPGALKNALDWVVGSGELIDKPVAVINASGRATHAWTSLTETLVTMTAHVVLDASVTIPLEGKALDANGIVNHPELSATLRSAIDALAAAVCEARAA
jgi:chromate reductase, NAD(P)H dehydrogenase (quinone)